MHLKVKGGFGFKEEDCPTLPISDPTDIYQIQNVLFVLVAPNFGRTKRTFQDSLLFFSIN